MGFVKLLCLAGLTMWKVLAVAGVMLLVLVPHMPPPPTSIQPSRHCNTEMSAIARRLIHQVGTWIDILRFM